MAFGSVSDILLRITGDQSDAADAIAELAGELAVFAKQKAEAEADVATEEATKKLQEMRARLEALDLSEAEPEVKAKVAIALAELEIVEGKVKDIDGETATVDVDVRRGALERLGAASTSVLGLTKRVRGLSGETEGLFSNLSDVGLIAGPFAARIGTIGQVVAILSPLIVSLGGALVALAASAGAALAGLGALGVAAGGVFAVGLGFAAAAVARFKDQADTAGTPANALKTAFTAIGDAAKKLLPAVDPVFTALARGLNQIKPLISFLAPGFKAFGGAAADAIGQLVDILGSPEIALGINNLIKLAGPVLAPLAQIAGQVFRIFLNIAQAAMPALSRAAQGVADALGGIADSTSNVGALRGTIDGLVGVLGQWLDLLLAVGDVLLGVFKAAAGPGTQLVGVLTDGAQAIADWVNSSEGQERIKQFFEDTLPLVQQLVGLVAQLLVIFIQVGEILAPALTPVAAILNVLLGYVSALLEAFLSLPAPVRTAILSVVAIVIALLTGVGEVTAAVLLVIGAINLLALGFQAFGGAASAAFNAAKAAAAAAWGVISGLVSRPLAIAIRVLTAGPIGAAKALWSTVKGIISGAINFAIHVLRDPVGAARSLWGSVKGIISAAISFVMRIPRDPVGAARQVWGAVKNIIAAAISFVLHMPSAGALVGAAKSIWDAINSALPDITIEIHIPTPHVPHIDVPGLSLHPAGEVGEKLADKWTKALSSALRRMNTDLALSLSSPLSSLTPAFASPELGALVRTPAPVGGGRSVVNHNNIFTPPGEQADPAATVALIDMKQRSRGLR